MEPIVKNHGTFDGTVLGAVALLQADVKYQELINNMEASAAQYATKLADMQTAIQGALQTYEQKEYCIDDIAGIQAFMRDGGTLTDDQKSELQDYTQQISMRQAQTQAAIKGIDPVLTTEQNAPSALQQGANEFLQEIGTVAQELQNNTNNRIG